MSAVIHWFRRDLRVSDNTALSEAARRGEPLVPVFVLEDALRTGPDVGAARLAFLLRSLQSLSKNLAELGYQLIVRRGRSETVLPALCREVGARVVLANKRYEPYAQARDERVRAELVPIGATLELYKDAVVSEEREVLTRAGKPFTVFTPYARAWKTRAIPAPRPKLRRARTPGPSSLPSDPIPEDPGELGHPLDHEVPRAGERAARERLRRFMAGPIYDYAVARNFPAEDGTSRLSPHLRCGTIGIRTVLRALERARGTAPNPAAARGCDVFLNELVWREFYLQILHNFPHVMRGAFRREYDALAWSNNRDHFAAWCAGNTGYPIVDAAMRCLNATGSLHNRLRMIVAMFLTKDLLINWQWGERHFMQRLVDGDLAANNGGWQWSAGTGTDAAPYFRIFNPVSQGEKFDPEGAFVRRWVPELAALSGPSIHRPWEAQTLSGAKYPERVVIHEQQRARCLAMYRAVKRDREKMHS